ncbi:MAG: bifunctional riboflavin kinase/FAD synthetase [Longicatena sp.]
MKIHYFDLHQPIQFDEDITACIGYFDGLHLGHQKLIERVLNHTKEDGSVPSLITFDPDPWTIIKHLDNIPHITPMRERIEIGEQLGIRNWIILRFEEEMQNLSVEQFHERVLKPLHLKTLVCGYDFHYASKGQGSVDTLRSQTNFQIDVVEEVSSEHKKIGSSRIEELIELGDVEKAAQFMGRYYTMSGYVKKGSQMGRKFGFPTANLQLKDLYVIPKQGVYVGGVKVDGIWHAAILNIGHNPTYNFQENTSIEAHLLDFECDLYNKNVVFKFCHYIREEKKFQNAEALVEQLHCDKESAKAYIEARKENVLCD